MNMFKTENIFYTYNILYFGFMNNLNQPEIVTEKQKHLLSLELFFL